MSSNSSYNARIEMDAPPTKEFAQSAALKGASLAFAKPPIKPKPNTLIKFNGQDGAFAAANKADKTARQPAALRNNEVPASGSFREQRAVHQKRGDTVDHEDTDHDAYVISSQVDRDRNALLHPAGLTYNNTPKTPSSIAASLAVSRSAPSSPNHTGGQQPSSRTQNQHNVKNKVTSTPTSSPQLDTSSIPTTTSLIGIFETKRASLQDGDTRVARSSSSFSPKVKGVDKSISTKIPSEAWESNLGQHRTVIHHLSTGAERTKAPRWEPSHTGPMVSTQPMHIPFKQTLQKELDTDDDLSSNESFISTKSYKPSLRAALNSQRLTSPSSASVNSSAAVDSMANAIVASSLASSRAASPSKTTFAPSSFPPPIPPPRRSGRTHIFHSNKMASRTPSPAKVPGLRTTMRKPRLEEDQDEREKKRARRNLMKKHPNKHHEGDRKRWRDEVMGRERKRYEAIWASNKGLFVPESTGSETSICNLVVRDIYSRSRLPADVLEEVYSLVDRQKDGRLEKAEFVVGLWLIDQRLKGRKLPIRVTESVWRSVGVLGGIKVKEVGR